MAKLKLLTISLVISSFLALLPASTVTSTTPEGDDGDDRRQIWIETQNADDPSNTLDIVYYDDRTCEISYRAAGRSLLGWVCDNTTQQGGGCIYRTYLCDGVINCQNAQDEDPAFCSIRQCEADKGEDFRCPSGRCLPSVSRCNSRPDCLLTDSQQHDRLAYDELFCPCTTANKRRDRNGRSYLEEGFWCRTTPDRYGTMHRQCVAKAAWCDGKRDCDDGEDENPAVCASKDEILSASSATTKHGGNQRTTARHILKTTTTTTTTEKPTPEAAKLTTGLPSSTTAAMAKTTSQERRVSTGHRSSETVLSMVTKNNIDRHTTNVRSASSPSSTIKKESVTTTMPAAARPSSPALWRTSSSSVLPASIPTSSSHHQSNFITATTAALFSFDDDNVDSMKLKITTTPKTTNSLFETLSSFDLSNEDDILTTESSFITSDDEDDDEDVVSTKAAPFSSILTSSKERQALSNSEEVTQPLSHLDHPGGPARQREEDMVVYIAIGTIAAAVFVGGLIFLIILNVRRSAAMAARKEKQLGRGYAAIPTSAIFSKQQATAENSTKTPVGTNNSCLQRPSIVNNEKVSSSTNHDDHKTDQTDMAVRQPLLGVDSSNSDALATTSTTAKL